MRKSTEPIPKLTNEKILSFFGDKNAMEIHAKIPPPTHVPGGGYWLNGIEVNVEQLFDAYRTYTVSERIIMSKK